MIRSLTGTWRLTRLALRRDRVKLPVVLALLLLLFISSVAAIVDMYQDAEQRLIYASTTATSVVSRVFGGPIDGPELGSIVLNETFLFTALAVAFMSTLTMVRHTRQNEEFGRSELIESGVVARHASLAAAFIVTTGVNVLFGLIVALTLIVYKLPAAGSLLIGAAMAAVGLVFAAVAAVTAQLADSARGANVMAALAIGTTFLLRGIGDGIGRLDDTGLGVVSAFPSWLSPFGWGQQLYPYTQQRLWVFGLFAATFIAAITLAAIFMRRRDIGLGMISTRPGRAHAKPSLLSSFGLARRLQRGILRGWAVAIVVLGVSFGAVIKEFQDMIHTNEQLAEVFAHYGDDVTRSFIGFMVAFMALVIGGYAVQSLLRMRGEEAGGQLESVLSTAVGRRTWLAGHLVYILLGVIFLAMLVAISMGATYALTTSESYGWIWTIAQAALVQSVAVFVLAGFVTALFALLPRLAVPLSWAAYAFCLLIMQIGVLLKLPQWVMNISPFGHAPVMPAKPFVIAPVAWLLLGGTVLLIVAMQRFSQRDISID